MFGLWIRGDDFMWFWYPGGKWFCHGLPFVSVLLVIMIFFHIHARNSFGFSPVLDSCFLLHVPSFLHVLPYVTECPSTEFKIVRWLHCPLAFRVTNEKSKDFLIPNPLPMSLPTSLLISYNIFKKSSLLKKKIGICMMCVIWTCR